MAGQLQGAVADRLAGPGVTTVRGVFGADKQVAPVNDGLVTIWPHSAA